MKILKNNSHIQRIIKGSRFLAYAYSCASEEMVKPLRDQLKSQHPHASHFCYAWVLKNGHKGKSDDGEPKGSAGAPILKRLESMECIDILLVVVRYFGGTKLGVGGLVRAYGGTAQQLLEESTFKPFKTYVNLHITCGYEDISLMKSIIQHYEHEEKNSDFGFSVLYELAVLKEDVETICVQLTDRSRGRITSTVQKQ